MTRSRLLMQKSMSISGISLALLVEEALEEEVVLERIDVGDPEAVGDEATGAGAPAGADGNIVGLGEAHEVAHDEEVTGEAHAADDVELPCEARAAGVVGRAEAADEAFSQSLRR